MVLTAVEDTLKEQNCDPTPTGYFAALLALLNQSLSPNGIVNKELTISVVYLLDLIAPHVPPGLLRSKFSQILSVLTPTLAHLDVEAPLLRSSIGCIESLLITQDAAAWSLPQDQVGPRRAIGGLLKLTTDHRPKVRKRAQDAIVCVLENPLPSPAVDHPAAEICAETALRSLEEIAAVKVNQRKKSKGHQQDNQHTPGLMHSLQLIKAIAGASGGGWPSKKIEPLCEVLLNISRSSNDYLNIAAFDIFEIMFARMAEGSSSAKLLRLLEAVSELRPSQNDSQLLPSWITVISRGYQVVAQIEPTETFQKVPKLFDLMSEFLVSSSHSIRVSASECMVSFLVNCVPNDVILEPSKHDEKTLEKLTQFASSLLSVRYQGAWMEVFAVLSALFESLRWRSKSITNEIVTAVGELRGNDSFNGKKEADVVLGKAIEAMGPESVLSLLPVNLSHAKAGQPGRAWLLPILRDYVRHTNLSHFRSEFVPLSETIYQRVLDHQDAEKTMQTKIFQTLVQQTWALLPGYCCLPTDLRSSFDQSFAELLSSVLYQQPDLRVDVCKSLLMLVESNRELLSSEIAEADIISRQRLTKADAQLNLDYLSNFARNLLSVLFNVYEQTLPQYRGHILQCINAYLSITPANELSEIFNQVTTLLKDELVINKLPTQAAKQSHKQSPSDRMPPKSHTLMDLIITISIYLPRSTYPTLFSLASLVLPESADPQIQKKAYKLLPRLAASPSGIDALEEHSPELQALLLDTAASATPPSRHDRLSAINTVIQYLPTTDLHFIPSILPEVVVSTKEVNEKARSAAFDLLVHMAAKMSAGGTVIQSKIPHMSPDCPQVQASLEEFFTMVSAGLVGSTPHMVSASITALTRILYEFHSQLPNATIEDMIDTTSLFLTSASREIVRSVLGFVKVGIVSLPQSLVQPRLGTLISGLMSWSHEHKAQFRSKVKHILERAVRRFGYDEINKHTPENDRKFLANIRKAKERAKRRKADGAAERQSHTKRTGLHDSAYDAAIQSSSDEGQDADSDVSDSNNNRDGGRSYIMEDEDSPLDLLDRKALGNVLSLKPTRLQPLSKRRGKFNIDGKLVIGTGDSDGEEDPMAIDFDGSGKTNNDKGPSLEEGINAYVDAIKGRDAVQRGRGGRLKFSNKRGNPGAEAGVGDAMDIDGDDDVKQERPMKVDRVIVNRDRRGGGVGRAKRSAARRAGERTDPENQRRGLGMRKVSGGRVVKVAAQRDGRIGKRRG